MKSRADCGARFSGCTETKIKEIHLDLRLAYVICTNTVDLPWVRILFDVDNKEAGVLKF